MTTPTLKLDKPPKWRRLQTVIGLTAMPATSTDPRVDRDGGLFGAGLIREVSVLTRGEALGHGFWVDSVMLDQCLSFMQAMARGLKCRFTHPGLSADGLSKGLGLFMDPKRVGDQIVADQHFYQSAHTGPDGDLAKYVMDRAEEDPEHFGTSIVFESDWEAEDLFVDEHQEKVEATDWQDRPVERYAFVSPDKDNVDNLPHARIAELRACDVVDDPAANPTGLFHRDLSVVNEATSLLDHFLGIGSPDALMPPASALSLIGLDIDPQRASEFVQRYFTQRGIDLTDLKKGSSMIKLTKLLAEDTPGAPPAEKPACTCPKEEASSAKTESKPADKPDDAKAELGRFVNLFGVEQGTKWYLEGGKTFEQRKDDHIVALTAENTSLKSRLAALGTAGTNPVGFSAAPDPDRKASGKTAFQSLFRSRGAASTN